MHSNSIYPCSLGLIVALVACDSPSTSSSSSETGGGSTSTGEGSTSTSASASDDATTTGEGNDEVSDGAPDPGESRTVFVTSTLHGPDLGGLAGADALCQHAAAGLTGTPAAATYRAWLGVEGESAADRLEHWAARYVRTDGSQVAADWNNLTDGAIDVRVNVDEGGNPIDGAVLVWTGTDVEGDFADGSCGGWTSTEPGEFADVGSADDDELSWTSFGQMPCDQQLRLYCIEQTPACGDGVVNEQEACDGDGLSVGGETATCDDDCTLSECGDLTINGTAGEECDDGNADDLDECSNACILATCEDQTQNSDEIDVDCGGHCGPGSCGAGQACTEDADCASMTCDASNTCTADSCQQLFDGGFDTDGIYTIDPDGAGPGVPFDVYCDMTNSGGGWSLIARFSNADDSDWMLDSGDMWYDRVTATGDPTDPSLNADAQSEAFWTVAAGELRLTRSDEPGSPTLLDTTANCLGGVDFRTFITAFGDFRNGVVWGSDSVAGTCAGTLAGNYATTSGFEYALCDGEIGAPSSVSFWSAWGAGDGAVIMIGGGGATCDRADHGIGVTEADAASLVDAGTGERDFGGDAASGDGSYAINLWVR